MQTCRNVFIKQKTYAKKLLLSPKERVVFLLPVSQSQHLANSVVNQLVNRNWWQEKGYHHNGDQAARWPHILCSIWAHSFGALATAVQLFIASLQSQKMSYQTSSIDMSIDLQPIQKGDFSTTQFEGLGDVGVRDGPIQ